MTNIGFGTSVCLFRQLWLAVVCTTMPSTTTVPLVVDTATPDKDPSTPFRVETCSWVPRTTALFVRLSIYRFIYLSILLLVWNTHTYTCIDTCWHVVPLCCCCCCCCGVFEVEKKACSWPCSWPCSCSHNHYTLCIYWIPAGGFVNTVNSEGGTIAGGCVCLFVCLFVVLCVLLLVGGWHLLSPHHLDFPCDAIQCLWLSWAELSVSLIWSDLIWSDLIWCDVTFRTENTIADTGAYDVLTGGYQQQIKSTGYGVLTNGGTSMSTYNLLRKQMQLASCKLLYRISSIAC